MFKLLWLSVFIILEVIVWFKLNGLLIVIVKLFMCSLFELVIFSLVKLLVLICSNVIFDFLLLLILVVLYLWLFLRVIIIFFVFLIMWLLVIIYFLFVLMIIFEFRLLNLCFWLLLCGMLKKLLNGVGWWWIFFEFEIWIFIMLGVICFNIGVRVGNCWLFIVIGNLVIEIVGVNNKFEDKIVVLIIDNFIFIVRVYFILEIK